MEERDFFDERTEKKPATLNCPHCHQPAEYEVTWVVRTKKRQLAGRADERDRARFAKARSYMLRKDDLMAPNSVQHSVISIQPVQFSSPTKLAECRVLNAKRWFILFCLCAGVIH